MALKHIGWQIGITYQTPNLEGLNARYLQALLAEMRDNGATFEDGYRAAVICDAILESARRKCQVDIKY